MRNLLVLTAALLVAGLAHAGDDLLARPDIYGTPATQWNFASVSSTTTIKSSPGVLHRVVVSSAPNVIWSIRDGVGTGAAIVISTFPASMTPGTYTYDAITSSGITVMSGAANGNITVTYR